MNMTLRRIMAGAWGAAAVLCVCVPGQVGAASGVPTPNLLQNPGFESGDLTGWNSSGVAISSVHKRSGAYGAWVKDGPGWVKQTVDVSSYAYAIDAGKATVGLNAHFAGFGTFRLEYFHLDATGGVLRTAGTEASATNWTSQGLWQWVAPKARRIRVRLAVTDVQANVREAWDDTQLLLNIFIDTPGWVTASDGDFANKVRVAWGAAAGATEYSVWRNANSVVDTAVRVGNHITETAFADTTAVPGRLYYYWVRAKNPMTISPLAGPNSGFRQLSAPTGLSAGDGAHAQKVRVTWGAVEGATGYEVWRSTSVSSASAVRIAASVPTPLYNDMSAVAGVTYYYWAKAKTSFTTSAFSNSDAGHRAVSSLSGLDTMGTLDSFTPQQPGPEAPAVWTGDEAAGGVSGSLLVDGDASTVWTGAVGAGPWRIVVDFGAPREVADVMPLWAAAPEVSMSVLGSPNGVTWEERPAAPASVPLWRYVCVYLWCEGATAAPPAIRELLVAP